MNQLMKYEHLIQSRRTASSVLLEQLKQLDGIELFDHMDGATYSHLAVRVSNRSKWVHRYRKRGVQLGILIEYAVPYMKAYERFRNSEYPVAKAYAEQMINFPNWPGVPSYEIDGL
jgi:dTDP-4-amino-4,6-dideoxygalactose transaminase